MNPPQLPDQPGTYILIFHLHESLDIHLRRWDAIHFEAGNLLYVGSAHGPGGLRARVSRHLKSQKRLHWHIDALTIVSRPATVWYVAHSARLECLWSQQLADVPQSTCPVPGFGSSDCRCLSHLYNIPSQGIDLARQKLCQPLEIETYNVFDIALVAD